MREIGGYLCLDTYNMPMRHEGAIALNTGRNCLAYLIEKKKIKKIFLPKFLCASVGYSCKKLSVEVEYYSVGEDLLPILKNGYDGWIYIVNYYGQLNNKIIQYYKNKYNNIIVDNVQAYFQEPCIGVDTIYSCRKFLGVTDGAFLYSDLLLDDSLQKDESWDRVEHILGSFEQGASSFYDRYSCGEEKFEEIPVREMSKLTRNFLHGIDYSTVEEKRTTNFSYLHKELYRLNKLNLSIPDGPYMYPLYINKGYQIREKLRQQHIFIPTLWPDVFNLCREDELEYDMAKNILPLPIDQRYGVSDMEYIVKELLGCIE